MYPWIPALALTLSTVLVSPALATPRPVSHSKPAIVLVAFGTSVGEARTVFDFIDQQARQRYAGYELRWAFTSQFIINKLKKQGVTTYNVDEVIAQLRAEGYEKIVFQSLHVVPGEEYRSVLAADTHDLQVAFGDALLTSDDDVNDVIEALAPAIDPAQPTVIVSHGNDKQPQFNERLSAFAHVIERRYPQLVVASVEGTIGTAPLQRIKALNPTCVRFVPLMIVAGDHIINDVLGSDGDSWKNIIAAPHCESTPSLGWNTAILALYFNHLDRALAELAESKG
ncbi:MAG: sirohydrochlorin cobaltochelatase [Desulfuromonadaceae bacterium]|nr:sirohydrochlorin cobaltochelatase [Desulfuromonadaceae bacterium]